LTDYTVVARFLNVEENIRFWPTCEEYLERVLNLAGVLEKVKE
jgi:putative component of membrane protein insertase Oxa1/YidC/SpoIIIJ protein YidD